jgi:dTDP-4-amino-4,6-dideoxygalactose transaminase
MKVARDPKLLWRHLKAPVSARRNIPGGARLDFFWARNGLFHALHWFGVPQGAVVLAPAFICTTVVEALVGFGARVKFYAVTDRCEVDLQDVVRQCEPDVAAIIAVHYFGLPQPAMRALRELCDARRILLIEDCAHLLEGAVDGVRLGSIGHASIFSWRKFLPIYDGGSLFVNEPSAARARRIERESASQALRAAKHIVDGWFPQGGSSVSASVRAASRLLRRASRRAASADAERTDGPTPSTDPTSDHFNVVLVDRPMSRVSRWVERSSDKVAIAAARRRNWNVLAAAAARCSIARPLQDALPDGACPWVFPVAFEGLGRAQTLLRGMGVPATGWNGVRPALLPHGAFPAAESLYERLVFLPLHQSLSSSEMDFIAAAVASLRPG